MDPMGMTSTAVASGNILAMKKAMGSQETIMMGLLNGMEEASQSLQAVASSAPVTGVNTSTTGGLDIRI